MNESEKEQDLLKIRNEIDTIDGELVKLFVQRMKASEKVAAAKKTSHAPVCDPVREREILAKVAKAVGPDFENEAPFPLLNEKFPRTPLESVTLT